MISIVIDDIKAWKTTKIRGQMNVQELIERLIDLNRPELLVEVWHYDTDWLGEAHNVMVMNLVGEAGSRTAVVIE